MARIASPKPRTPRKASATTRVRRTAEASQDAILDAAERRLVADGPAGIRLTEVAADVGVSHPTVLHHFGSRDKLVAAVVQRRIDAMNAEVLRVLTSDPKDEHLIRTLFERLSAAFGPGGHARTVAYLALEGWPAPELCGIQPLAAVLHANRAAREGSAAVDLSDSYYSVLLVALALFGDALVGPLFRGDAESAPTGVSPEGFRAWLATLMRAHLDAPSHERSE